MKGHSLIISVLSACFALSSFAVANRPDAPGQLRVNRIGYLPDDVKVAVYLGDAPLEDMNFVLRGDAGLKTGVDSIVAFPAWEPMKTAARIYFTSLNEPGNYTLYAEDPGGFMVDKADVYIGSDAYSRHRLHEMPLYYLRQQRCGFNPVHNEACHVHDGRLVLSGDRDGEYVDVTGGWHDASDYLQYLTTSANTVYQMLFAYRENPDVWGDDFDAKGLPGSNGVPDILDEARWGLEWMQKMNPEPGLYLNQIADDRDHKYAGIPSGDNVDYGWGAGKERAVYPCSATPYGLGQYKNESTGLASSVGKFASSFGLGAEVFAEIDPEFAADLERRSAAAYDVAKANPGACQTAPCISPYYYEEDNWADDMELAAMVRYRRSGDIARVLEAVDYQRLEPVTPWMGADSAYHYQWYPFVNLGHYELASLPDKRKSAEALRNMRSGLSRVVERGTDNVFGIGIPFIWCSNNLAVAFVTQAMLYRELTGDNTFAEAEALTRDWLFGLNPWDQMMVILPHELGPSPHDPHSAMSDIKVGKVPGRDLLWGGLVDGPIYTDKFNSLWGVHLRNSDPYAGVQNPDVVYHDDYSDYSTNEPTMDGTASLTYMLGKLVKPGLKKTSEEGKIKVSSRVK